MSQKSFITTRSQTRRAAAQERNDVTITDSGMQSERVPGSPSVVPTISTTPALVIPWTGGRVIDHRDSGTSRRQTAAPAETGGTSSIAASRAVTQCSRKSTEYLRKRAEYEAELEVVRLREQLVRKKLEADLAQIDAAEEDDENSRRDSDAGTTGRVAEWVHTTPLPTTGLCEPVVSAPCEVTGTQLHSTSEQNRDINVSTTQDNSNVCVISDNDRCAPISGSFVPVTYMTTPIASALKNTSVTEMMHRRPPGDRVGAASPVAGYDGGVDQRMLRGTSGLKTDGVDRLTDAIRQIARPRPIPRQAYELPHFTGDPAEWLSYRNMYWETAKLYEFKPHENIARLKTSLKGDAKIAVEDLLRTSTDPSEIIQALEEEYGHPTLILQCALNKVRNLPKVSESGKEFRHISTAVRNCVSLLRNIKAEGYVNNPQLVNELLLKLTPTQRAQYGEYAMRLDQTHGVDLRISPNLQILSEYLAHQARISSYHNQLDMNPLPSKPSGKNVISIARKVPTNSTRSAITHRVHVHGETTSKPNKCAICEQDHLIVKCNKFLNENSDKRWELVKKYKLCFKCLVANHAKKFCKAPRCKQCNFGHHDLLHAEKKKDSKPERVTNISGVHTSALLKVLPVTVCSGAGEDKECYALLDDGATVSLIDSELAKDMAGPTIPLTLRTARGLCVSDEHSRAVSVNITGPNGEQQKIKCRTINNLNLPPQTVGASVIRDNAHLRDLGCAEMRDAKPLLLLGQDNWELLVGREIRRGRSGKPVASLTKLGWVLHGPSSVNSNIDSVSCMAVSLPDLHGLVKSQFELESIGISQQPRQHAEVKRALDVLDSTSCRVDEGRRWQVGLLWKQEDTQLPDNRSQALQRLEGIERRMRRDPAYAEAYTKQIDRLIGEGYARKLKVSEVKADGVAVWYLPHFGVANPNKPGKLRLVFDAAAAFKGSSLNDKLLAGPDLLNSLVGVLLRFRIGPVAFAGDIADMFLRIKVRPEDQNVQRFLWRGAARSREPPDVYAMTSMIFGAVSSPTSAIYILNKNASEYEDASPRAVEAIRSKHYMDDYLDSVWTAGEAHSLIEEVSQVHASGGFIIRGWVTNSAELREKLQLEMPERMALEKGEGSAERTLGMIWAPGLDSLAFDLSFKRLPKDIVSGKVVPTKRQFLSFIMSIFDPLGFLYPCVIQSRVLMQRVWGAGTQWDEPLRQKEARMWFEWLNNLKHLREFAVPRWYGIDMTGNLELHIFGDASELAYAAVAYLVGYNAAGEREVAMLLGKARVAPQKVVSIPRLELQAAVLASRLGETVERELGLTFAKKVYWTDSMTVLNWINSDAYDFKKFVSHRLAEIDRLTDRGSWRWVPSAENPADRATRLDWPNDVKEWNTGPLFLRFSEQQWPARRGPGVSAVEEAEAPDAASERVQRVHTTAPPRAPLLDHSRMSTWTLVVRALARALAFISRCRRRRDTTQLCAQDLRDAEHLLLREMQEDSFAAELRALRAARPISTCSKLRGVDPMLTDDGLLRVRGRLGACEELSFGARHPIILDGRHPLAVKLASTYHVAALHANHETVVNNVREKFWVLHLRPTVRKAVSRCQVCRIRRAQPAVPKMADLPTARLTSTRRAFVHVGVDYFGPMEVAIGRRREKRWGCLFTCLATRAVHLELAASLSTDSAILALRRLIARRGRPAHLYSDRGTNFVGADNELRAALRLLDKKQLREDATARGIEWHFNPPAAPHMGGCWERLVRSVKTALRATLRERAPREETLQTLLAEAELVINSRPLYYVPSDSEHPQVITPNHLLLGTASGDTPFINPQGCDVNGRSQWRRVNALADMFWRRWLREYLPTLQVRQKWTSGLSKISEGDVVAVVDEARPRSQWTRGIVDKVYFGNDNVIRVIDIRTRHGVLRRPVVKVIVLPTEPVM